MNPSIQNIWGSIVHKKKYGPPLIGGEVKEEVNKANWPKEVKKVKQCHNCKQQLDLQCQVSKSLKTMKPDDSCSRWS